jgi:hypothetical protein
LISRQGKFTLILSGFGRADHKKEYMGLTSWEKSPKGKIVKPDVSIAKNYLTETELESLGLIVNGYLDFAEDFYIFANFIFDFRHWQTLIFLWRIEMHINNLLISILDYRQEPVCISA